MYFDYLILALFLFIMLVLVVHIITEKLESGKSFNFEKSKRNTTISFAFLMFVLSYFGICSTLALLKLFQKDNIG